MKPADVIEGVIHIRKAKTEAGMRRVPVSAALGADPGAIGTGPK